MNLWQPARSLGTRLLAGSIDVVAARLHDGRPYTVEMDSLIVTYGWMAHSVEPIGDLGTIPIHQSAASHPPAKRKGHQVRTLPSF